MSSPSLPSSFTISAASVTDLWRKPPAKDDYNAPSKTVRTRLGAFKRARTTLRADWTRLYDHGGFVVYGPRDATLATQRPEWWIKAGVELFPVEDGPAIASVAAAPGNFSWSDWAITPGAGLVGADGSATVELEVKDGALWFYVIKGDGKRVALREITWWKALDKDLEIEIGAMAARTVEGSDPQELHVEFTNFELDLGA